MMIDPNTLRKGDMLLSPDGQLFNVTDALVIAMQFAFADEATHAAVLTDGWNPLEDDGKRRSFIFTLQSLDGQEQTSLSSMSGEPIPDGWEIVAKAPEQLDDESAL
jgi:hypothetical protein